MDALTKAQNMKNPKKKNQQDEEEEGDDDSVPDDFDFDEFTEQNHLGSLQDFADYAKGHKNQMKNMQIIV